MTTTIKPTGDYLSRFITEKRSKGVPWGHIANMANTHIEALRPYIDAEKAAKEKREKASRQSA